MSNVVVVVHVFACVQIVCGDVRLIHLVMVVST